VHVPIGSDGLTALKQTGSPHVAWPDAGVLQTRFEVGSHATGTPQFPVAESQVCKPLPSGAQRVSPALHVVAQTADGVTPHGVAPLGLHVAGAAHSVAVHWYPVGVATQVLT
jgi:hypothetical protein